MDQSEIDRKFRAALDDTVALAVAQIIASGEIDPTVIEIANTIGAAIPDALARLTERGYLQATHP